MPDTQAPGTTVWETTPAHNRHLPIMIGLDIGGTKTHGLRFENGKQALEYIAGSANVQSVSRETAQSNLAQLFHHLGQGPIERVYVGAGGIDTAEDAEELRQLIQPFVPEAKIAIVHDSRLLLAAGGVDTGVAVIAGTGSAAWGRNSQGDEARAGGWGYLLGDEGSGYWLGREAVRHSLDRMNRNIALDALGLALLEACGIDQPNQLIALFHSPGTGRRYWAQRGQLVAATADQGHQPSQRIINQAAQDLARITFQTLTQLEMTGPIILGGGLGRNSTRFQEAFRAALAEWGIHDIRVAPHDPVHGVKRLAAEMH